MYSVPQSVGIGDFVTFSCNLQTGYGGNSYENVKTMIAVFC